MGSTHQNVQPTIGGGATQSSQVNKANTSDTEAPFLDLHLSISNGFVSSKIYDKRDDFDFDIVNFPFLDGDVPRSTFYGVTISQLIRFARVCIHVADFNAGNKSLTAKLFQQDYRYHKLRKTFSKFYRRRYELVSNFNVGLKPLLFGKELFIRFTACAFRKLLSVYACSYFLFGFEGRMWDLIVSVSDRCLSFNFVKVTIEQQVAPPRECKTSAGKLSNSDDNSPKL